MIEVTGTLIIGFIVFITVSAFRDRHKQTDYRLQQLEQMQAEALAKANSVYRKMNLLGKEGKTTLYEHPPDILTPQEADQVLKAIEKQKQTKLL